MSAPVLQQFALNFWTLTVSKILYRVVSIGVAIYLARELGAEVLGGYTTVMTILTLFLSFSDLGVTNLVIKDVSQDRNRSAEYLDNFFLLQLLVGIAVIGMIMLTGVLSGYERLLLIALAIGALGPFFSGLSNAYQALMNAHELFYPFAVIEVVCMLVFLAGNVAVVLMGEGLLALVAVTSVVSLVKWVLGALWARRFQMRVRWRIQLETVKSMLIAGLPFLLINGAHFAIQRMDVLFLSWMTTQDRVGIYGAASRLVFASLFLLAAVGALLYPVFSRLLVEDRDRAQALYTRGTLYVSLLSLALAQLLITLAPEIIRLLFGAAFAESTGILQLLALFIPLFGIGLLASNVLMVSGEVWHAVGASVAGLLIGAIAAPLCIATWEIHGAAYAVLLAESVAAFLYLYYAHRRLQMSPAVSKLVLSGIVFILPPLLLVLAAVQAGIVMGVVSILASVSLLFLLRVLTFTEVNEMRRLLLSRKEVA